MAKKEKVCTICGASKLLKEFFQHPACRDGLYPFCIDCKNAVLNQLRKLNQDWTRYQVSIRTSNRRAKRFNLEGRLKPKDIQKLHIFYGSKCLACGSTQNLTVDHIKPMSLGGSNDFSNLQLCCLKCNLRKGLRVIDYRP